MYSYGAALAPAITFAPRSECSLAEDLVVTETPSDPNTHAEVAAKLLDLAAGASSPAAREQFTLLAALYERLASSAQRLSDAYLPMDLSGEDISGGRRDNR